MTILQRPAGRAKPTKASKRRSAATLPRDVKFYWSHSLPYKDAPKQPRADISEQPTEVRMHVEAAYHDFLQCTGMSPTKVTIAVICEAEF